MKLSQYAKLNPRSAGGVQCRVCGLPAEIIKEINKGYSDGLAIRQIEGWLASEGYKHKKSNAPITAHSIGHHTRVCLRRVKERR